MKAHYLYVSLFLLMLVSFASPVSAQSGVPVTTGGGGGTPVTTGGPAGNVRTYPKLTNPLVVDNVQELLYTVVDIIIFLGVIVAVFIFIFIGFKFVWSQGDPEALKDARRWFLYAVIGTAILIGSKVIVDVIKNTLTAAKVVNEDLFKQK